MGSLAASLLPTPVPILNDDDHYEFFWETASPFSQWHKSPFIIDGITYPNAESCMMAGKARLFGDAATCAKILTTTNAREIKALGREVTNFDEEVWKAERAEIIYRGNLAKFQQNENLRKALLDTGDRVLVEAAPNDAVYGIGIDARKARITPVDQWPGLNLLGKALMRVRTELRASVVA